MSLLREGLRASKVLVGPILIGAAIAGCRDSSDIKYNPLNCSGQPDKAHMEFFLPIGQEIFIFDNSIKTNKPGEIELDREDDIRVNLSDPIQIADNMENIGVGDARVAISPEPAIKDGIEGTNLVMEWNCN